MYVEEKCTDCQITLCLKCLGFFFSYWIFFLLTALNSLLNTGIVTKHSLIHQVLFYFILFLSYLHFGELCDCGFYDRLLSLYQYIVFEGNRVLTLNLTITESTSEMYSRI